MMHYDLARLMQHEIRKEAAAGKLVNQAVRATRNSPGIGRARFDALRRMRRAVGVALIRVGLGMAGRDVSASPGTPMI